MCETLGALCSQFYYERFDLFKMDLIPPQQSNQMDIDDPQTAELTTPNAFQQLLPRLLQKLESIVDNDEIEQQVQLVEILSAVCLQSMLGYFMPKHVLHVFENVLTAANYWTQYRIARSASRYGQHFLAARIYDRLAAIVSLEKLHFFLSGLSQISKAECIINFGCEFTQIDADYDMVSHRMLIQNAPNALGISERLEKAVSLYLKALTTFKVNKNERVNGAFEAVSSYFKRNNQCYQYFLLHNYILG